MPKPRACRPTLQPLEGRVVLSLSFGKMMDSLFPFLKHSADTKPAAHRGPAHPQPEVPRLDVNSVHVASARPLPAPAASLAHPHPHPATRHRVLDRTNPPGSPVATYGPFLGRPGHLKAVPEATLRRMLQG